MEHHESHSWDVERASFWSAWAWLRNAGSHVAEEVIKAGASTLDISETVGYTLPTEYGKLIAGIKANTKGIENAISATHCHNDLGLATTNTLAGTYGGARQLEVTVNGIDERAGNAF
eukprot:Gb_13201 [translate_table: standard]